MTLAATEDDIDADPGNTQILVSSAELNPQTVTATEVENEAILTTSATGSGTTQPDPNTIHPLGSVVTLSATPDPGFRFIKWTGDIDNVDDVNASTTTITLLRPTTLTATFAAIQYVVVVTVVGEGSVDGGGIFAHGSQATVTAIPAADHHFVTWTGDHPSDSNPH